MLDDVWVVEALKFLPHYPLSLSPHVSESKKKPSMCPGSSPPPLTASPSLVVFWWRVTVEVNILVRVKAGGQDLIMP